MTRPGNISSGPILIDQPNLSLAWAEAVSFVMKNPGAEITPMILTTTGFDENGSPIEDTAVRESLDALLKREGLMSVEDIAFTIFPQRLWQVAQGDREKLFQYYRHAVPRYQAMNKRDNGRGLYFERLIMYPGSPCGGNQLEWLISQFNGRGGVRRSMFQASIFDPSKDHVSSAQLQFPCLQHVSFEPTKDGLVLNAFYATQQLFVKAYGNYLGIAQLASFVAKEMGMRPARINVIVGVAKLERISKRDSDLVAMISASCKPESEAS